MSPTQSIYAFLIIPTTYTVIYGNNTNRHWRKVLSVTHVEQTHKFLQSDKGNDSLHCLAAVHHRVQRFRISH